MSFTEKTKNVHIICHNHKISLDTHSCIMFCIRSWNSHGRKKGLCLCGGKGLAIKCPILTRICKFTELVSNPLELQIQLKNHVQIKFRFEFPAFVTDKHVWIKKDKTDNYLDLRRSSLLPLPPPPRRVGGPLDPQRDFPDDISTLTLLPFTLLWIFNIFF